MTLIHAIIAANISITIIGWIFIIYCWIGMALGWNPDSVPEPTWKRAIALWFIFVLLFSSGNIYDHMFCNPVTYSVDGKVTKFEWDCEKH